MFLRGAPRRRASGQGRAGGDPQRPVREPAALHLPRVLPAGLQGQRQGQPADHPHPRRPGARRRDPAGQPRSAASHRRPHRRSHRRRPTCGPGWSTTNGPGPSSSPGTASKPPGCCCCRPHDRYPDGLGNNHDQVGRYLMVQGAPQTAGRFDDEIRMYKAPPPEVSSEQFYETDPTKPYRRGWSIQTVSPLPITWAEHVTAQGHWGEHAARVHARLRALGHPRRAVRIPAPPRQPGHPRRRDRPPRPARRALLLQPSATTTSS